MLAILGDKGQKKKKKKKKKKEEEEDIYRSLSGVKILFGYDALLEKEWLVSI